MMPGGVGQSASLLFGISLTGSDFFEIRDQKEAR